MNAKFRTNNNYSRCLFIVSILLFGFLVGEVALANTYTEFQGSDTLSNAVSNCSSQGGSLPSYSQFMTDYDNGIPTPAPFGTYWLSEASTTDANYQSIIAFLLPPSHSVEYVENTESRNYFCVLSDDNTTAGLFPSVDIYSAVISVVSPIFQSIMPYIEIAIALGLVAYFLSMILLLVNNSDRKEKEKIKEFLDRGTAMKEKIDKLPE